MTTTPARALIVAAVIALAATTAACSTQEDPVTQHAELAARPTSEAMVARYEQMQQRIRDELDTAVGPFTWYQARPDQPDTCGFEFPRQGGRSVSLGPWAFDGNIPDADWPGALDVVARITGEYGFEAPALQVNTQGRHTTNVTDPDLGALYTLSTNVNTIMSTTTGCHLPG